MLCFALDSVYTEITYKQNTLTTLSIRSVILLCITWLISSCYSYRAHVQKSQERISSHTLSSNKNDLPQVFVINPSEFPTEYEILRKANLYSITSDSTSRLKVRLKKMHLSSWGGCMTGPATMVIGTLGQVPVRIPEGYSFALEEIQNGESRCMEYHLQIDKRIWFWDTFSWRKSKNRELAKVLQSNSF